MVKSYLCLAVALGLMAGLTACRVRVNKDANGEQKNVQVDTPFGGVHVNANQTTAANLGLPVYPGAVASSFDEKDNKSADVRVGFGEWQLHVQTASYESADAQDKVAGFYRQALSKYGDVIACQSNQPVGTPKMTRDGLTCDDDSHRSKVQINSGDSNFDNGNYQLKAGSKRHQHIVGFGASKAGRTRFSLVSLDLPADTGKSSGKSD
jgi:hypothetical protein